MILVLAAGMPRTNKEIPMLIRMPRVATNCGGSCGGGSREKVEQTTGAKAFSSSSRTAAAALGESSTSTTPWEQALRKQHSATKKNQLRLMPITANDASHTSVKSTMSVEYEENAENHYYPFHISTLNGSIRWELSAASSEERAMWVERIESITNNSTVANNGTNE
mmetsp:Transcript_38039/g.38439  ORF Transcript_38039/g.38439 Transcript_38039/m.38439 type:complete len:166 (+) Transcript_38039:306-803(+)